jgi:hypothetical protein
MTLFDQLCHLFNNTGILVIDLTSQSLFGILHKHLLSLLVLLTRSMLLQGIPVYLRVRIYPPVLPVIYI